MALLLYTRTLLPGFDLGDSASFQADMSLTTLTPRQAYPLYLTIGRLAARVSGGDPARALNLMSAVFGALACGTTVWVGSLLTGSSLAGIFAGLLLASSYTFWSQAVVAEVYTLHVFLIALCCAALLDVAATSLADATGDLLRRVRTLPGPPSLDDSAGAAFSAFSLAGRPAGTFARYWASER